MLHSREGSTRRLFIALAVITIGGLATACDNVTAPDQSLGIELLDVTIEESDFMPAGADGTDGFRTGKGHER